MLKVRVTACALAALALASPTAAKVASSQSGTTGSGTAIVDELLACRANTDAVARLACFDRTAERFALARERKEVQVVDQAAIKSTRRSLFGLTLPQIDLFGDDGDDAATAVKEITSTVQNVRDRGHGMYALTLADGTGWAFTEELEEMPRVGETITIKVAALGGYKATLKGRRAVRIKRER